MTIMKIDYSPQQKEYLQKRYEQLKAQVAELERENEKKQQQIGYMTVRNALMKLETKIKGLF